MLDAVEVLVEDVYVERLELGLEHVVVVADADGAERVQRVLLHQHVVVHHEVERRLEHLVHRVTAVLKQDTQMRLQINVVIIISVVTLTYLKICSRRGC